MKKLLLIALAALWVSCTLQNESGVTQSFIVTKTNGDTIRLKALEWRWDGSGVVFTSRYGSQYISDVKDIIFE